MKKLFTALLVMVFIGTTFTGAVFSQGSQSMMGGANNQPRYNSGEREYVTGYNILELSEEQVNEIADLREEFYNETEELRDQLRSLNRELRDLEFRGASNAEIGEIEDKIEEVLVQMDEKRIANQEKMESVLTEEQLDLIEENRLNYGERFQGRSGRNFGPGFHHRSFNRDGYSRFNSGFGRGMMGRGFSGRGFNNFMGSRNYNNRDYGYGSGWCH